MSQVQRSTDGEPYASIVLTSDLGLNVQLATLPVLILAVALALVWLAVRWWKRSRLVDFEIDAAELGFGDHKVTFKPNLIDRQIAYSIWVELSTRKIGLPINLEDDVVAEIYDSWYSFFSVTRDLIKTVPVSKVRNDSTGKIIKLSIEVLNEGLRPHLTKWQARFRHWYDLKMETKSDVCPQDIQKSFPAFEDLSHDMMEVNARLQNYRVRMYELVTGRREPTL